MAVTREGLVEYMARNFGLEAEELRDGALLFSTGLLDSFNLLDVVTFIETEAGIRMGALDVNLDNLDSIDRILAYVQKARAT